MSYSQRMRLTPDGEKIVELKGDLDCKAEEFANLVVRSPEFEEISGRSFGAENFLSTAVISQEFLTPVSALDVAIARYLAGDRPGCRALLEELVSRKEPFFNLHEAQVIGGKILDWAEHDHSHLDRFIEACVSKNVARHFPGLQVEL